MRIEGGPGAWSHAATGVLAALAVLADLAPQAGGSASAVERIGGADRFATAAAAVTNPGDAGASTHTTTLTASQREIPTACDVKRPPRIAQLVGVPRPSRTSLPSTTGAGCRDRGSSCEALANN